MTARLSRVRGLGLDVVGAFWRWGLGLVGAGWLGRPRNSEGALRERFELHLQPKLRSGNEVGLEVLTGTWFNRWALASESCCNWTVAMTRVRGAMAIVAVRR
jgi:hypothetical protein